MLNTKKLFNKILSSITQIFAPTVNTITPLGFFKNLVGGYCQIGKICIVNCSAYIDGTFAANDFYTMASNLPHSATSLSALTVTTANNAGNRSVVASVSNSGQLVIQSGNLALSYYTIFITGIYITT